MNEQKEPFGYFRVEPFGWVDCGEKDEGAVALYDQGTVNELLKQRDMLLDVLKQIAKVETHGGDISASWTLISVKHLAQGLVEKVKGGAV